MDIEQLLSQHLTKRKEQHLYRTLYQETNLIDFSSNDYLGLSQSAWIKQQLENAIATTYKYHKIGATGSRLLNGNSKLIEEVEAIIAKHHHAESALIFNSGYNANVAVIATLCYKNAIIFYDELIHASLHQGIKLAEATAISFKHNDYNDLEKKINEQQANDVPHFVIVESVYSMDGDEAPLQDLARLSKAYQLNLIIDEAHATGIFGKNGSGKCNEFDIETICTARIYTFGKALGAHGAAVVSNNTIKEYLINYAKPFIYTTALSLHSILHIKYAYHYINQFYPSLEKLKLLFNLIKHQILLYNMKDNFIGSGPIFSFIVNDSLRCRTIATQLQQKGFDVKPIVYPTVAKGKERIRICIHNFNTEKQILQLFKELARTL